MTEAQLRQALDKLPPQRRRRELRRFALLVKLAQMRKEHQQRWAAFLASGDESVWDAWLIRIGAVKLQHQMAGDTSQCVRQDNDPECQCDGCMYALQAEGLEIEGSARGSRGLRSRWSDSQAIREGQHLHNLWVHGLKRPKLEKPEPNNNAPTGAFVGGKR